MSAPVKLFEVLKSIKASIILKADKTYVDEQISQISVETLTASEILTAIKTVDGDSSGLDADKLDAQEGSYYLNRANHTGTQSADTLVDGSTNKVFTSTEKTKLGGIETGATADQTASEILTAIKTVDGASSGLDSDLLDGKHASDFAAASHSHSSATSSAAGFMSAADKSKLDSILQSVYPVGSVYISTVSTNPATLFGFGTWVAISGRFLIGADGTYTAGSVGGQDAHTHSIPTHSHGLAAGYASVNMYTGYAYMRRKATPQWYDTHKISGTYSTNNQTNNNGVELGGTTDESGALTSGSASTLPPYLAVYIWKRTA